MKIEAGKYYCDGYGSEEIGPMYVKFPHDTFKWGCDVSGYLVVGYRDDGVRTCNISKGNLTKIYTPPRFEIGKTYKTALHGEFTCIHVAGDYAWLAHDFGNGAEGAAYVWNMEGKSISLSPEWDVVWDPVVTTHNHVVFAQGESRNTQYNLVDGKVDWDSFEVLK